MTTSSFQREGRQLLIKRASLSPLLAPISAVLAVCAVFVSLSLAHPGSGIVVDGRGQVFFQDSAARTIWKVDRRGRVTAHYDKLGGHLRARSVGFHFYP